MLITPSAIPYDDITPEQIAMMPFGAEPGTYIGPKRPSSEWRFHLDIMEARPEVGAIVHTHAPYATALAMARREIPACHYMIARFGGAPIRLAKAPPAKLPRGDIPMKAVVKKLITRPRLSGSTIV